MVAAEDECPFLRTHALAFASPAVMLQPCGSHERSPFFSRASSPERRPARMDAVLELVETLPCRFRWILSGTRHIFRRLDRLHGQNVARAIRKDCARGDANDELRAHGLRQQRIVVAHAGTAVDAHAPRLAV